MLNIKVTTTPKATIFPSWRNGGASEKLRLKNPTAVVIPVIATGTTLTLSDSAIASALLTPSSS